MGEPDDMNVDFQSPLALEMYEYLKLLEGAQRDTESYISTFRSLDEYMIWADITEKALPEKLIYTWLGALTVTPRSKNYIIGRVRKFSRYLVAIGIPAYEPDFCKTSSPFTAYTFSDEEFAAIIDAADNFKANAVASETSYKFPVLLRVLYSCGLRVGEALSLHWADVDLERGIIHILKAKNNKQRRVPVSESLNTLLKRYRQRCFANEDETAYLFGNSDNDGIPFIVSTFRYWFIKILQQANISNERKEFFERCISPHILRHYFTFKSFLNSEAEGRSFEETVPYLSNFLGHETFFGTEKYLTTDYTMYSEAHNRLEAAIESLFPEVNFE